MPYQYLDHEADIGILSTGDTLEETFEEGAKAMFNVMVDLDTVEDQQKVEITVEATDIVTLFIEWLNELLAQSDINGMFFSNFRVEQIEHHEGIYQLKGSAYGESRDVNKHNIKTEVKGATYYGLKVWKNGQHHAQCVLDV
ncbi:MAG: archease [Candidatus Hodarchaeota archaeon]